MLVFDMKYIDESQNTYQSRLEIKGLFIKIVFKLGNSLN